MHDQNPAHKSAAEQIKAWDPDFTKVTPDEAQRIKAAEESGFIADSDIDWDHLSDMKLDEADEAAITSDFRFTGEEVFSRARQTSLDKGTQRKTTENELPSLTQCTA